MRTSTKIAVLFGVSTAMTFGWWGLAILPFTGAACYLLRKKEEQEEQCVQDAMKVILAHPVEFNKVLGVKLFNEGKGE